MDRMPAYIPPHLRKKVVHVVPVKTKGVHWPSNVHGDPSANVKLRTISRSKNGLANSMTRSAKYSALSRALSKRTLRAKPLLSVLKSKKTRKIRRHSV